MNIREMIRPTVIGLVVGGVATAFVGFYFAGWMTTGKAGELATRQSSLAVGQTLTPYCVAAAMADPNREALFATMKEGTSYDRKAIISKSGWATPLGATAPHEALATACEIKLSETL